jgi:hypothetical protein
MTTLNAYLSKYSGLRGTDLHKVEPDELARGLWFTTHDYGNDKDYVLVGTAEVTVTLMPQDAIVSTQIVALRAQQDNIKATAYAQTVEIERQIQSLLAITNEVQA